MELPAINTNLDLASHAHPLPIRTAPREQQIRAMVARIPITVDLRGLSFGRNIKVSDVLTPKVRRTPLNKNVNPDHLDVIECWKGLSHTQAMELAMWYQFLHECLHNEVREALTKGIVTDLLTHSVIEEVYLVARVLKCLQSKPQRIIDVSFAHVIDSMMSMFHDRLLNDSASFASSWSSFPGGLSLFLHKFLSLQDCFYHRAEGPCLEVSFAFQFADWVLKATGDVMWQPPSVRFLHVPTARASGETYRITPFIWKEADSPIRSPGCDDYVDRVDYKIVRSPAIFAWDPAKGCFKTVIRHPCDGKPRTIETVISARITTLFSDDIMFEKESRWSMKLDVTPTHQSSRKIVRENWLKPSTVVSDNRIVVRSPQKRKVSKPGIVNAVDAAKRRRHDERLSSNDIHESCLEDVLQCARRDDPLTGSGDRQAPQHGINQPVEIQCDSGFSSVSTSPVISQSTTSDDAAIPERGDLHQEDILHNYHEFVDRRLFKDAGLITSPISDSERRAYEGIFMEDSDEWSPSTEERSYNMDAIMSDE